VFLAGHTVAMVTICVWKMKAACSLMIEQFFDARIAASTDKKWSKVLKTIVSQGNWAAQKTTTNRIISSQGLIIIQSRRNTFIICNQNKRKSSLYLVAKFRKCQCKLNSDYTSTRHSM